MYCEKNLVELIAKYGLSNTNLTNSTIKKYIYLKQSKMHDFFDEIIYLNMQIN